MSPKPRLDTRSPFNHSCRFSSLDPWQKKSSLPSLSWSILNKLENLAHQVKVPLRKLASVPDEVGPRLLATNLASQVNTPDDVLDRIRGRADAGHKVRAVFDDQLTRLEPDGARHFADFRQAHDGEVDQGFEGWVLAPALTGRSALAVWVREDGRGVAVGVAVAGDRRRVSGAVFLAGREAVLARGVEVVAAETLLGEDLGGAVVFGPGVLAAGDGGVLGLRLGR